MTLAEWTARMIHEFTVAGFSVTEHQGFPLVETPDALYEKFRLLKFTPTLAVEKRIYAEGMLIVPYGVRAAAPEGE